MCYTKQKTGEEKWIFNIMWLNFIDAYDTAEISLLTSNTEAKEQIRNDKKQCIFKITKVFLK